jgi:TPR repeat protein
LSNNKGSKELAKAEKCLALKQAADADYSKNDYDSACKKYTELSELNPKDRWAKQGMEACCSKSPELPEETPIETEAPSPPKQETTLSVSKNTVSFDAYGGELSLTVSTNASIWSVSGLIPWCKITKQSETSVTLICEPNAGTRQLESYFYIQAGDKQQKINVVWKIAENPLELGDRLFKEGKYDKALDLYTLSAEQGSAEAQNRLGRIYAEGNVVEKNPTKAMDWFRKSAMQGNVAGENNLGYMYEMQKKYPEALRWYLKSAYHGYAPAQYNLGLLYQYGCAEKGCGIRKNKKEAEKWYKKSAEQGYLQAIEQLKQIN